MVTGLSRAVLAGFWLLLASGASFLVIYALGDPTKLTNPKLWAKIAVVGVLALIVHRFVLPRMLRQVGRRLFEGVSRVERDAMLMVGAVSGVSWMAATVLGAVRELNFSVAFDVLVASYLAALCSAALLMLLGARLAPHKHLFWAREKGDKAAAGERPAFDMA